MRRIFYFTNFNNQILSFYSLKKVLSIKDDLFNWFLTQAKSKDQHAVSTTTFKLVFINKIPLLDPNSFSQNALHLYQELFKIYKHSFLQQQQSAATCSEHTAEYMATKAMHFKQIELAAVDYIAKLAFKSTNNDVSLAAIQFLNAHYTQPDTIASVEYQHQFVANCMSYLNAARVAITKQRMQLTEDLATPIG
jgi:ubiquitin carboxyl-terminal hydrolase 34